MSKHIHIFAIGRNYRNCRIFTAERRTRRPLNVSAIYWRELRQLLSFWSAS
jgi:hypothetical protein